MTSKTYKGFSIVEIIIALATILLIGAVVYTFVNNPVNPSAIQNTVLEEVPTAPEVSSIDDLSEAQKALSEVDIDDNTSLLPSIDSDLADL